MIEKAISDSDLGLSPNNDGNVIRLNIPSLTEERRKELVRQVHKIIEDGKISIRNIRRDANEQLKKLEKSHDISEDNLKRSLDNKIDSSFHPLIWMSFFAKPFLTTAATAQQPLARP